MARRFLEQDAHFLVLNVIRNGESWSNGSIKTALEKELDLSNEDRARANRRENEPKWYTIVNNCLQDGRGLYKMGLVERVGRGEHRITAKGRDALAAHEQNVQTLSAMFDE
jgi:restriction endonuclease Mrr